MVSFGFEAHEKRPQPEKWTLPFVGFNFLLIFYNAWCQICCIQQVQINYLKLGRFCEKMKCVENNKDPVAVLDKRAWQECAVLFLISQNAWRYIRSNAEWNHIIMWQSIKNIPYKHIVLHLQTSWHNWAHYSWNLLRFQLCHQFWQSKVGQDFADTCFPRCISGHQPN